MEFVAVAILLRLTTESPQRSHPSARIGSDKNGLL